MSVVPLPHPLRIALALVALNLLLTLSLSPEAPWVLPQLAVSPDLLLAVALAALLPGRPLRRSPRALLTAVCFGLAATRFAGAAALDLLGRPLDPVGDLPHLGRVAGMLGSAFPGWIAAGILALGLLAILGLALVAGDAIGVLDRARAGLAGRRRAAAGLAAAGLLVLPVPRADSAALATARIASSSAEAADLEVPPLAGAPDLGGADLYLIFVESYGVVAFEDEGRRARLAGATERWARSAEAAGFDFRSAQIQAPTFGGGSWRSHAALLSGVRVDREAAYRALVVSDRISLVRHFGRAGYRTVAFEPGIRGAWPEADWYGFDRIYDQDAIGYEGPAIGWWIVPDQFTLHALRKREIEAASRPLFAKVSLITSHIPYWPVPPYIEPWARFDDQTAFAAPLRSVAHDDHRDLDELSERYAQSLEYVFRILGGFLRELGERRALVAVIGDHQPPKLALHDSDTWATPIHLFSRDPELLAPFEALGFARTLTPLAGTSWRMSDFPRDLRRLFPGERPDR